MPPEGVRSGLGRSSGPPTGPRPSSPNPKSQKCQFQCGVGGVSTIESIYERGQLEKFFRGRTPVRGPASGAGRPRLAGDTSPGPPLSPETWQARAGKPFLIRRATGVPGGTRTPLSVRSGPPEPWSRPGADPSGRRCGPRCGGRDQGGWGPHRVTLPPAPEKWWNSGRRQVRTRRAPGTVREVPTDTPERKKRRGGRGPPPWAGRP